MNTEVVKQVIESIKTLNLNVNDATTQKLVDVILPVVKWYYIMDFVKYLIGWACSIIVIAVLAWMVVNVARYIIGGNKDAK